MLSLTSQLLILAVLLIGNGFLTMSEMAIVSARKVRLQTAADNGDRLSRTALEIARAPKDLLATVQVGITLVGILLGALGETALSGRLEPVLAGIPSLAAVARPLSVVCVVLPLTVVTLVWAELVPKRIALMFPEQVARVTVIPAKFLLRMTYPLVAFLGLATDLTLKLLGLSKAVESETVTEEEIRSLVEEGARSGSIERVEQDLVVRALAFGDRKVKSIMTPRPDVVWVDVSDSTEVLTAKFLGAPHSHFPVGRGTLDNCLGVLHVKDLLPHLLRGDGVNLLQTLKQPLFVPETSTAARILEMFKQTRVHVALVVDEYGMVQGVVTLNDLLEAVVGDLPAASLTVSDEITKREDGSFLIDGLTPLEDLKSVLGVGAFEGEDSGNFHTLAGFVMQNLGRVPRPSDCFTSGRHRFEVVDMDGNRVDKVLVSET